MTPPVPGSTPGKRLPWDVMGLFKTHTNSLLCFASDSKRLLCSFCYSGWDFPLSNSYCWGVRRDAFRHSAMTHQSGDSRLPLNIWQRVVKWKIQRKFYPRGFYGGVQAASSTHRSVLWKTFNWFDSNKGVCNIEWCSFLVFSSPPYFLWEGGVSIRGSSIWALWLMY